MQAGGLVAWQPRGEREETGTIAGGKASFVFRYRSWLEVHRGPASYLGGPLGLTFTFTSTFVWTGEGGGLTGARITRAGGVPVGRFTFTLTEAPPTVGGFFTIPASIVRRSRVIAL